MKASKLLNIDDIDFKQKDAIVEVLRRCGGYYECPKDANGKRLGPLVGYAGTYFESRTVKQYVGEIYYNFAKVEQYPHVIDKFAELLAEKIRTTTYYESLDCIVGMPMGSIVLGSNVARKLDLRFVFAEKNVVTLRTETSREQSELVFNRHRTEPFKNILIVEDVCNNFSSTEKIRYLIKTECRAVFSGIACVINRSADAKWEGHDVVSLLHSPTKQFRQDDDYVSKDIDFRNVIWKPKDVWKTLDAIMRGYHTPPGSILTFKGLNLF